MPAIGLAEAARLTGKNQSTIHRAMKTGRLSYTVNETGERRIDVAELERVFGIAASANGRGNGAMPSNDAAIMQSNDSQGGELAALQRLLDERERTIADLRESIREHREDLRRAAEERRMLLAMLTDQRARPWWKRWFR
jgi:ABC-type transporter Mla subunit MlaD